MEDFRPENPKRPARTGELPKNGEPAAPAAGGPHRQDAASPETDLCVTPDPCDRSRGFWKVELSTLILKRVEVRSLGMTKTTSKSESGRAKLAPGAGVQSGPAGRRRRQRGRDARAAVGDGAERARKQTPRAQETGSPRPPRQLREGARPPHSRRLEGLAACGCGRSPTGCRAEDAGTPGPPAEVGRGGVRRGPGAPRCRRPGPAGGRRGAYTSSSPRWSLGLPRGEQLPRPNRPVCLGSALPSPDRAGAGAAGPGWRPAPPLVSLSLCVSLSICDLPDIVLFYVSENFIYYHFSGFSRGSKDKWV